MTDNHSAFFFFNGEKIDKFSLPASKLLYSFYYGGSFFETIRIQNGLAPLLKFHLLRIKKAIDVFSFENFSVSDFELHLAQILKILQNQGVNNARLRVQFFPIEKAEFGKNYNFFSEVKVLPDNYFKSYFEYDSVAFYNQCVIYPDKYSAFKSSNYYRFLQAGAYAKSQNELVLIKNSSEEWVESQKGNLFFSLKGKWYTPDISAGCIDGVLRNFILNNQKELGIEVSFKSLTSKDLMLIDSLMVTNAFRGVMTVITDKSETIKLADSRKASELQQQIENLISLDAIS
ncbi:MAG: hypothetical protein EA412_12435 [Chitinophagaceae bacterium]|nr:MAG: hypothetical protein EA412_12435 [Chitinophagaceae bacterium]